MTQVEKFSSTYDLNKFLEDNDVDVIDVKPVNSSTVVTSDYLNTADNYGNRLYLKKGDSYSESYLILIYKTKENSNG